MSKIRKLYYSDKKDMREMVSFLNNRDKYSRIIFNPIIPFHHILPLRFKFLPESYVLKEDGKIKGLITVSPAKCPLKRLEIQSLFFEENSYDTAGELVWFVLSTYKAKGASSFIVRVDDCLPELAEMFIQKCNFSRISEEQLVKISTPEHYKGGVKFRNFRNSDASAFAKLYNDSLLPHFRPLLGLYKEEFEETPFKGLIPFDEYKYVCDNGNSEDISCGISIRTSDNENYVVELIQALDFQIDLKSAADFAYSQIRKRRNKFNLYIKINKYAQLGERYMQECLNGFETVQNKIVLTNSSAKIIKNTAPAGKFTMINPLLSQVNFN